MQNEMKKTASEAFATLCDVLDDNDWKYDKDEEKLTVRCSARGDDLPMQLFINVDADRQMVSLLSQMPFSAKPEYRDQMAVAVSLLNAYTIDGCFDYNYSTGNVIFRITMSILKSLIGKDAYTYLISCACSTIDDYNDKLLYVATNEIGYDGMKKLFGLGGD